MNENQFFTDRNKIRIWLKENYIKNFTIENDLTVNVAGDVDFNFSYGGNYSGNLPVQFGHVKGDFCCAELGLTTLKGSPHTVEGLFSCGSNPLSTLEYAPKIVKGKFIVMYTNITTLEYCPMPGEDLLCNDNKLVSLIGAPKEINGEFNCADNRLRSLKYGPKKVLGSYKCGANRITSFTDFPKEVYGKFDCSDNHLKVLKGRGMVEDFTINNNPVESLDELYLEVSNPIFIHAIGNHLKPITLLENYYEKNENLSYLAMNYDDIRHALNAHRLSKKLEKELERKTIENKKIKV